MKRHFFVLAILGAGIIASCRESIDSTTDLRYQDLIVGAWLFQSPDGTSSTTLIFDDSSHVRVINTRPINPVDTTYTYFIDAGILHFTTDEMPPVIVFSFAIEALDFNQLTLYASDIDPQRQTFYRTSP